jgi:transposase
MRASKMKKGSPKRRSDPLQKVHRHAAGIDIGATQHFVAVPADLDPEPVRSFGTFTGQLHQLAECLASLGITTIAMESTGVYWIPVFEILEARGFEVLLVNARDVKNVPGRKTDVNDAQWLQQLHEYGLLRASFRPREQIAALRTYLRHRERLVEYAAAHIQHMQKALMQMNLQLHHVVTDITGVTGMQIIEAILSGERDPHRLAKLRDVRCHASEETIAAALEGNWRPEHLFALRQAEALYQFYQARIRECDAEIEAALDQLCQARPEPKGSLPEARAQSKSKNAPSFEMRRRLHHLTGVDLTQIHGLGPYTILCLIGECGDDMSRWRSAKHFTSWLTLSPGNKISGGRLLSSKTRPSRSRAAHLFRMAAVGVGRTQTALGAFYRRLASRVGKAKAVTATARKLAVLFYNAMRFGMNYVDPGVDYYEERYRQRITENLRRRAKTLGLTLVPAGVS